ncbi:MAG: hypothetical protein AB7O59_10390 [Pirellulales bacterium]
MLHVALALTLAAGCRQPAGPVCFPVSGQVLKNGRPLAEALVAFHPVAQAEDVFPKPSAVTDAEGRFRLMTFTADDGAPAGRYAITVELRATRQVGEELVRDGPNTLPKRYASPQTSQLEYEVVAGENAVPPLVIEPR